MFNLISEYWHERTGKCYLYCTGDYEYKLCKMTNTILVFTAQSLNEVEEILAPRGFVRLENTELN